MYMHLYVEYISVKQIKLLRFNLFEFIPAPIGGCALLHMLPCSADGIISDIIETKNLYVSNVLMGPTVILHS